VVAGRDWPLSIIVLVASIRIPSAKILALDIC